MADTRKIVRVFLASPGDLKEERRTVKAVADEINNIWADSLGYQVELVGWEDTVSVLGRPQEIINRELKRCEYFIGMLWKRWGTPPNEGGNYSSGFEEEFEISSLSHQKSGSPQMSLFFKKVDDDQLYDPGPELRKVLDFKRKIEENRNILYENFETKEGLETQIRRCMSRYIQDLKLKEEIDNEEKNHPQKSGKKRLYRSHHDSLTSRNRNNYRRSIFSYSID